MIVDCLLDLVFYDINPNFVPDHCAILERERKIYAIHSV